MAARIISPVYLVSIHDTLFQRMVKGSDIYVLSGLLAQESDWSYRSLAEHLRVPHPVVQRAPPRGLTFVELGQVQLQGIAQPVRLLEARWA